MFDSFPQSTDSMFDWAWSDYEPYANNLSEREVNADTIDAWLTDWTRLAGSIDEVFSRLYVAKDSNTVDEVAEQRFVNFSENVIPKFESLSNTLNTKLLDSGLEPDGYAIPIKKIRTEVDLFSEDNLPLFTEERKLGIEYDKIMGAQTVEWEGEEVTLIQLGSNLLDTDRAIREKAWRLGWERRLQDKEAFDDIWVKFMNLRKQIAENAGEKDYRDFMWKKFNRFDYTPDDAQAFFSAIEQTVVPATVRWAERRRQQMGLDTMRPWDGGWRARVDALGRDSLKPFKEVEQLESISETIFNQVDSILGNFMRTMRDENLLDLDNRKNKSPGGYCTYFPVAKRPFIFMNAVGTHGDVQTMLHEAGHAFHAFLSSDLPYYHHIDYPIEIAEVASMAMELLAAPNLTQANGGFYSEAESARARTEHLEGIILFWPYMACVAAFQHWVYTNHETATNPDACDDKWVELWGRFIQTEDWSGFDNELRFYWRRQGHIFQIPFYYIEYGLAQLGAVQVWANSLKDHQGALQSYQKALKLGGTKPLPELFATAGAKLAFDSNTLGEAVNLIETTLDELATV